MPPRPLFPPTADAPIRLRLVIVWGLFFVFVLAGVWFFWREGTGVAPLIDLIES